MLQVQEKLAMSIMQEEERRMFDTMHEAEYRRMETRWAGSSKHAYSAEPVSHDSNLKKQAAFAPRHDRLTQDSSCWSCCVCPRHEEDVRRQQLIASEVKGSLDAQVAAVRQRQRAEAQQEALEVQRLQQHWAHLQVRATPPAEPAMALHALRLPVCG